MKHFEWENKEAGTFFLHGDRWIVYFCPIYQKIQIKPNYNLHTLQKVRYTKGMSKTIAEHRHELENVL